MVEGIVKWFNEKKGYGFIRPNNGQKDVFVHINDVQASGYKTLIEKEEVEFEITEDNRGRTRATNITAYEYVAE
jgi:CspA family cold shock protein